MGDAVEFLPADKHKSFLQDDSIMPNVRKATGLQYLCNKYDQENLKDEVGFLPADKHRRFL